MGIIKQSSARRLVAWFALLAVLLSAITVTAYAVTRPNAAKPPKRSLAGALHTALSAKPVAGVSARFTIAQNLLGVSSSTFSASPIGGASGTVWVGGGHVRVQIRSQLGTTEIAYDGHQLMLYDRSHHVAYVLPVAHSATTHRDSHGPPAVPTVAAINRALLQLGHEAVVSGAIPSNVAGRPAYEVRMSPRRNGGLVGDLALAWDASHGVPLRFALYPRGSSTPAISVTVTHIRYGTVPSARLQVVPAAGTRVVHVHLPSRSRLHSAAAHAAPATGVAAVSRAVGFRLAVPHTLAGLGRGEVRSVNLGKTPAALVTYGHGLGTVFVLEQAAGNGSSPLRSLPSASIAGTSGHELQTTLGSLVQFTRGGVTYTVIGSQPATTIMTAAQALA
jgi:hypothetical protein